MARDHYTEHLISERDRKDAAFREELVKIRALGHTPLTCGHSVECYRCSASGGFDGTRIVGGIADGKCGS